MSLFWYVLVIIVTYFICESTNKISNKVEILALIVVILSPLYFEYPNTGVSVPATFSEEKGVVKINKYPFGVPTVFSDEYSNIPNENTLILVALDISEKQLDNSDTQTLVLNVEVFIDDENVYFEKEYRRGLVNWLAPIDAKRCRGPFSKTKIDSICKDIRQVVVDSIHDLHKGKKWDFEEISKDIFKQGSYSDLITPLFDKKLKKEGLAIVNTQLESKIDEKSDFHIHWL
ncbi:hypothetical protein ACFL22_01125 [Patescibacteria group bacterium]